MADGMWLFLAAFSALVGMGLLALSLEPHWRQACSSPPPKVIGKTILRTLGSVSLACALTFCLLADHATMAVLVWAMFLASAAFIVGMLLVFLPATLKPLSLLIMKTHY